MTKRTNNSGPSGFSFENKILLFFILIVVTIIAVACLYVVVGKETNQAREEILHAEHRLKLTDSVISLEREMTIHTLCYLMSGRKAYQEQVVQEKDSLHFYLQLLGKFSQGEDAQPKRIDSLERNFKQYTAWQEAIIHRRQQNTLSLLQAEAFILEANPILATFKETAERLKKDTKQFLSDRRAMYQADIQKAALVLRLLLLVFTLALLSTFIIVYRNTRQRNKVEADLKKSKALIRSLIEHAPLLVNVKDLTGTYTLVNQQFAYTLHASPEDVVGKTLADFIPRENAVTILKEDEAVVQAMQPTEFEVKLPGPEGLHTYIATKFPLLDERGSLYAIGSTYVDITPVTAAHEALQKSYQKHQQIVNGFQQALSAASDVLCIINQGTLVMVSDTSQQLLGYTPKEIMHKRYIDFIASNDRDTTLAFIEGVQRDSNSTTFTNHCLRKDGTLIPVTWSVHWVPEERMLYCIGRDATEGLRAAQQLAQSQERLVHAQKIAKLGNWEWDIKNNIWSCSSEVYRLLGRDASEKGNMQTLLLEAIYPEDKERILKAREDVLNEGRKFDTEFRIIRSDGEQRHVHVKGEVRFNATYQEKWFSGTIQDITERKHAELLLQQANEALEKRAAELKESNEELERFAYVASHDLQEPLRMVSSFLSLLQKRLGNQLDEASRTYIHFATDGAKRMKQLIQDLLHYSRLGSTNESMQRIDMNEVVSNACHLLSQPIAENGATIRTGDLPCVWGHSIQLNQLVLNLLTNALKYRGEAPPVIEIGCTEQADWWEFSVKDNGIGIDPKFFDKIFIIFQRLHKKSKYSGTGIGLALCKKIIERHGGHIRVESAPGKGSTFYFTLKKRNRD